MGLKLNGKGIIFSPDFVDLEGCLGILEQCSHCFSAVKIGNIYLYKYGIEVVGQIKRASDLPLICDFKLMDIPDVAEEIIRMGVDNGMDGAMVWGLAGEETIARCISSFPDTMIFLLTEYTHTTRAISADLGDHTAELAIDAGAYGIQAPATRPARIKQLRELVGPGLKIISCGVGYQGTPYGMAVQYGADFEIIGRKIYTSSNPAGEAAKAFEIIQRGFQE